MRKVPTSTSITSAPPCTGSWRRSTAWANGTPIQAIPNTVIAIEWVTPRREPARQREREHERKHRDADQHDLELGAVVRGHHHRRDRGEGDRDHGAKAARHPEQLPEADHGEADHRQRERDAANRDR